ncbi:MAG: phosphonate C-P lyase system protein PhnG [Rhizobiales bacterium PAR1]|nr:MAG: phosphonate C-P lyase system protein PhnG [Rhizobiales bacterium PAR1]
MTLQSLSPPASESRRIAMGVLARAQRTELEASLGAHWPNLDCRVLRQPETGLVMLRGRIGGDGAAFNLGEATVSRAVIELPTGERGYGQVLGRDREHARLAAILDALWQKPETNEVVETSVLRPIRQRLATETAQTSAETAATRVDFFTLVRGED